MVTAQLFKMVILVNLVTTTKHTYVDLRIDNKVISRNLRHPLESTVMKHRRFLNILSPDRPHSQTLTPVTDKLPVQPSTFFWIYFHLLSEWYLRKIYITISTMISLLICWEFLKFQNHLASLSLIQLNVHQQFYFHIHEKFPISLSLHSLFFKSFITHLISISVEFLV